MSNLLKIKNTNDSAKTNKKSMNEKKTSDIDSFCSKLKNVTVLMRFTRCGIPQKTKVVLNNNISKDTITINKKDDLGHGAYGYAYKVNQFVIKIQKDGINYDTNRNGDPERCSRILNTVNNDQNFARSITLNNGEKLLVSKFIKGKSITGEKAFNFVKSQNHIIFDSGSNGNVRKDKSGKLYLIDADCTAKSRGLVRTDSIGTIDIHNTYKNAIIKRSFSENTPLPLYYSQIKHLLPEQK